MSKKIILTTFASMFLSVMFIMGSITPFAIMFDHSETVSALPNGGDVPYQGVWMVGDGHMHTSFSDGMRSVEDRVWEARENGLDFIIITDHHNFINTLKKLNAYSNAIASANSSYPDVIVLWGLEFGYARGYPHILAYGMTPEDFEPYVGKVSPLSKNYPQEAINIIHNAGGVAYLSHPTWSNLCYEDLATYENLTGFEGDNDGIMDDFIKIGAEWDQLLIAGKRYTIVGNTDAHGNVEAGQWVANFVYCPNATEAGIWEGYKRGIIYYSESIPIGADYKPLFRMEFTVNDTWMGQTLKVPSTVSTVRLWINVTIVEGASKIDTVTVIQNGSAIQHISGEGSANITQYLDLTSDFLHPNSYLRIFANDTNGRYAVSNPVFLEPEKTPYGSTWGPWLIGGVVAIGIAVSTIVYFVKFRKST
jgi:hypothetical protein